MQSILSAGLVLLANTASGFLLPHPSGKYNVSLTTGPLVDYTRKISKDASPRALMLSIFEPTTCASTVPVPYMPNKTAIYQGQLIQNQYNISLDTSPIFLGAQLPVCPSSNCSIVEDSPILLLSPGYGGTRLYYSVIASAIASEGFTVITIDHPEDTNIITYPDGHAVYGTSPMPTMDEIVNFMYARAADASFIIDQLSNATAMGELLPQRGAQAFPTDRIAMLGHSLGGAASVYAASRDPRILGAINWDGSQYGSPKNISQPVLLMSSANRPDPTWDAAWLEMHGPKLWLDVAKTMHSSFLDIPTLLKSAGLNTSMFESILGTIEPAQLVGILTAYTASWMGGAIEEDVGSPLLRGEDDGFPEVRIVKTENF